MFLYILVLKEKLCSKYESRRDQSEERVYAIVLAHPFKNCDSNCWFNAFEKFYDNFKTTFSNL